ncbi:PREDICTED: uncharacterized protein LOC104772244 [Camelina sativa]|uniref:Uncharacterized protein LOC104772244 n=1 Tax=Camelina sativa TaxID=90675 RepID=A0ABM0Y470_CAMSA|nr:PREDICTED: uncharacterized protein LOC104772244 [Camelina sativa]
MNAREEPRGQESGPRDLLQAAILEWAELMRQQAPSFVKIVETMRNLGTEYFRGGSNTFEADNWLRTMERNFEAIQCQEDYKKDVAVHYLKDDASDWWIGVKRHYGRDPTWDEFRNEFEGKYFPPEARDRLENEFINLKQGEKSVRELEAIFTRLRKYVYRGRDNEAAMTRHFLHALRPDIQSRPMSVTYQRVDKLAERAVNVEEHIEMEKEAMRKDEEKGKAKMMPSGSATRKRSRSDQEESSSKFGRRGVECFSCGESGHYFRECPRAGESDRPVPSHIICYNCGKSGHYMAACPMINAIEAEPEEEYPPLTSPEEERLAKQQVRGDRVYRFP